MNDEFIGDHRREEGTAPWGRRNVKTAALGGSHLLDSTFCLEKY